MKVSIYVPFDTIHVAVAGALYYGETVNTKNRLHRVVTDYISSYGVELCRDDHKQEYAEHLDAALIVISKYYTLI